jgi:hypothetical protein
MELLQDITFSNQRGNIHPKYLKECSKLILNNKEKIAIL